MDTATFGGPRQGPPSKKAFSALGASAATAGGNPQLAAAGTRSAGGVGATGRHAAARAGAKEVLARQQVGLPQPQAKIFQFPPAFEAAVARQAQFFKRMFSPEVLTEPLPPALRLSLTRNFAFFTRIFTQFFDPNQQREVRQAIPGLSKRQ